MRRMLRDCKMYEFILRAMRLYYWDMQNEYKKLVKYDEKYYLPPITTIEPMLVEKFCDQLNHEKREKTLNRHVPRTHAENVHKELNDTASDYGDLWEAN